jgi:putative membrane protein
VAAAVTGRHGGWHFVLVSAAAFTAWDLFLDPQMVGWGYWVWAEPGGYFGIPWINFSGWFVSAALITLLVRPKPLPAGPLIAVYTITWLLQTVGQAIFWHMPGPALCGFVGMGVFVILSMQHRLHQQPLSSNHL